MLSTQLNTVTESEALRSQILSGFTAAKVEFRGETAGPFADRIVAEGKTSKGTVGVIGALHGDFGALDPNLFEDLTPLATKLKDRGFPAEFLELGKMGTAKQIYIPWMQATYILGVNKQALQYLPTGVSVDNITYQQLTQWCKNISDQTSQRCGLPGSDVDAPPTLKATWTADTEGLVRPTSPDGRRSGRLKNCSDTNPHHYRSTQAGAMLSGRLVASTTRALVKRRRQETT